MVNRDNNGIHVVFIFIIFEYLYTDLNIFRNFTKKIFIKINNFFSMMSIYINKNGKIEV
jgi:hypothetical protein